MSGFLTISREVLYDVLIPFLKPSDFRSPSLTAKSIALATDVPLTDPTFSQYACTHHDRWSNTFVLDSSTPSATGVLHQSHPQIPDMYGQHDCELCNATICQSRSYGVPRVGVEQQVSEGGEIVKWAYQCGDCQRHLCLDCLLSGNHGGECWACEVHCFESSNYCCTCYKNGCEACGEGMFCNKCKETKCEACDRTRTCQDCDLFVCETCCLASCDRCGRESCDDCAEFCDEGGMDVCQRCKESHACRTWD